MACNCPKPGGYRRVVPPPAPSSSSTTTQSFAVEFPDGSRTPGYGSKLEAEAARVRSGYRGHVVRI